MSQALYDRIGGGYAQTRRPDPRIAAQIARALGEAESVVNVGAGAGSYEPRDRRVVPIEPSRTMISQRPGGARRAVQGSGEALPLLDDAVDVALAVLTMHHWSDATRGLAEMRRVARRRVVILTWDEGVWESFWLVREYCPGIGTVDRGRASRITEAIAASGRHRFEAVPVPHDCLDGFCGAYWRRPEAYLEPQVRAGISAFALMPPGTWDDGLRRLAADLASGAWHERHRELLDLEAIDLGYRLAIVECDD